MAKDIFHDLVKEALIKDGWLITADPLRLTYEDEKFEPDLVAEKILIAERGLEKIAVEIKSFIGQTFRQDFYEALGQYLHYNFILSKVEPDRHLVLAVPHTAYANYFGKSYVLELVEKYQISILIYHTKNIEIVKWIR